MTDHGERVSVSLYLLAGLATSPNFMESFRGTLHGILEREGFGVRTSQLLFPYGDWSRRAVPQLWEISRDMRLGTGRLDRSIGGSRAVDMIGSGWKNKPDENDRIVLIGHSGGGVAAVHAAWQLYDQLGGTPSPVVMIGSPRCRIPEELRASVLFVYAGGAQDVRAPGKPADGVSRLGTFGGWFGTGRVQAGGPVPGTPSAGAANEADLSGASSASGADGLSGASRPVGGGPADGRRRFWPAWRPDKHAPAFSSGVPIIGKHADYFREHEPYINELGLTNQRVTLSVVWPWLRERI